MGTMIGPLQILECRFIKGLMKAERELIPCSQRHVSYVIVDKEIFLPVIVFCEGVL